MGTTAAAATALLSTTAAASAEELPLTLAEALALAEKANPELLAAAARVEAQRARAEAVGRGRWPRAALQSSWSRTDLPAGVFANKLNSGEFGAADFQLDSLNDPEALGHLGTSLGVELPIDVFGKVGSMADAMTAYGDAGAAATRDATHEIRARVVEAYRRAEVAGRSVAVTERALAVAQAREAEIEARVEAGASLKADLLRARARRREREAELAERRSQQRMAQASLGRLLGAADGTSYVPSEGPPEVAPLVGEEAEWVQRALQQRPALEAARRRREAAAALARNESKGLLPDLGAFGQVWDNRTSGGGSQAWAVGIGLRWAPFDPGRSKRQAAATAEERASELDARAAADQVRLEVQLAYRRATSARERHGAAQGGAEEGREALRVVQERRQAGVATLTDELETETAALQAALAEIAAAAEVAMADAALRRAAGEI
jgi:outer membrane protein